MKLLLYGTVFGLLFLFSCNQPADVSSQREIIGSDSNNTQANPLKENKDEVAARPVVVRHCGSGINGNTDTLQVSQYIRRIFQDSKGNLWFGTVTEGACCYDGKYLRYYTLKDSACNISVQDIAEDKNGNLWFGTSEGVVAYDGLNFTRFTEKDGLLNKHIQSLFIDSYQTIWAGTPAGVCRCSLGANSKNVAVNSFSVFQTTATSPKNVRNIIEDKAGTMWFATDGDGVYKYDNGTLSHLTEKEGLGKNGVRSILQDKNAIMWFATQGGGLTRFDPLAELKTGGKSFITYKDEKGRNEVETLYEDKAGNLWVSVRGGVRCYQGESFTYYSTEQGLTNCCVQSIFEDIAGNIWLGSGAGLFYLKRSRLDHPCYKNNCKHNLQQDQQLKEHKKEIAKTIVNVTTHGPWPSHF